MPSSPTRTKAKAKTKSKYKTKLHALIAKGPVPSRRAWQDSVLTYLTQHCSVSNSLLKKEQKLYFPSPLPVNVVPKSSLLNELKVHELGDTPLLLAVRHNCTSDVVAALCHLHPDGALECDDEGSLPLHLAAKQRPDETSNRKKKRSSDNEVSKTLSILVEANPVAIVSRDDKGRTPLHCLLENYPETRNLPSVELLGRIVEEKVWKFEVEAQAQQDDEKVPLPIPSIIRKKLPKQANSTVNLYTPASSISIPDTIMGAIPLHYAVKHGLSKDIVAYLIKSYPASVCQIDAFALTPLHWAFGVEEKKMITQGEEEENAVPTHHTYRSSSIISMLLQRDPSQSFNVATMRDRDDNGNPHRLALHYAVELLAKNIIDPISTKGKGGETSSSSCITLKSLKALIDADPRALSTQDALGQTPVHVLFRTIFEVNDAEYKKFLHTARTGVPSSEKPKKAKIFTPPKVLVDLLITGSPQDRTNPTTIADIRGLLPLHCAVLAVSSPTVLGTLIDQNPKSLTHLTNPSDNDYITKYYDLVPLDEPFYVPAFEGSRTPLHMAYACPYIVNTYNDVMIQRLLFYDSTTISKPVGDGEEGPPRIKIDASIALKMQDSNGDTPIHLAAKHYANFERLSVLLQRDVLAAITGNNQGDLPLHLLLDKHFLFVNAELASAHSGTKEANPLTSQHSPEFREKVRELAKKQTIATRMAKFQLCGAIFAPTNGWTNDDEDSNQKDQSELMQKVNLLGMPLIDDEQSLYSASSQHGLLPLHIMVAFHAVPYQVVAHMLQKAPTTLEARSTPDGYTALDLHIFRKSIPGEIKKDEQDAWKAICQLLFVQSVFPLDTLNGISSGGIYSCRTDMSTIHDIEQQIIAEVSGQAELSYHTKGNHPVEPNHLLLGFMNNLRQDDQAPEAMENSLSMICAHFWVFISCYFNLNNPDDNYSQSVRNILSELDFAGIDMLTNLEIPAFAFKDKFDPAGIIGFPTFTVDNYANVFCKAEMFAHKHFAGLYTFSPPSTGASLLIHRQSSGQAILVKATQMLLAINSQDGTNAGNDPTESSWLFTPASDVRLRKDFTLTEVPVCFKFIKDKLSFTKEVNWRTELEELIRHSSIVPIVEFFSIDDTEQNKRYIKDRQDERFRKMPLRSKLRKSDIDEWINMAQYPFAIVMPLSVDGNLHDVLSHGLVDPPSLKDIGVDMGHLLKDLHNKGLMHGTFGVQNILSFPRQSNGLWSREWKLTGMSSLTPISQTSVPLGAIYPNGRCSYESRVLPPEMFKKIDPLEQTFYNNYWNAVFELANVNISKELINPRVDPNTGDVYVVKCYCHLDETTKRSLPPLPYDLVEPSTSVDLWAFGISLFTLITGGEMFFRSNIRTGTLSNIELTAKWNHDMAATIIQQYVPSHVAQDLLLFLLSTAEERQAIDMNTVMHHPYFISDEALLPPEVTKALAEVRDERSAGVKLRKSKTESDTRAKEIKNETTSLSRLSIRNHLLLVNSTTEVIREAFDPKSTFSADVPYCYIVLPYKLAKNKAGKLTPTSMTDVELSERLGKQLLELCKATCFASCLREFYTNATKESLEIIHHWSSNLEKYPIQTAEEILKTFHLDPDYFLDLASKFVAIVRTDNQNFLKNPTSSAMKLVRKYVVPIAQIFSVNGKAYLYPVDEIYGMPIVESSKGRKYPHTFRDCVADVVYKSLPYMVSCITRMMSESGKVESLVKLIFEGAAPKTPLSWVHAARGIPTVFLKRRMVAEASILQEAMQEMIPTDSPVALNGKHELNFIHSLFTHIDSGRAFGGLKPVSDGNAILWTRDQGVQYLMEDCERESDPDHIYTLYKREEEQNDILAEKDALIAKLKKKADTLSRQLGSLDSPEMEI